MREPANPSRPYASKKESAQQQRPTEPSGTLCPEDSAKRVSPTSGATNSSNTDTKNRRPGPTPLFVLETITLASRGESRTPGLDHSSLESVTDTCGLIPICPISKNISHHLGATLYAC